MIICVIEGFGLNLEPYVSELCPAWAEFKERSTLYVNNYSVAASTCQACVGLLTGEYPAYSSQPRLEKGYSRDIKNIHRTFLSAVQGNSVALLTSEYGFVVREVFERIIDIRGSDGQLKAILRDTPQPRLIWIYIFPGLGVLHAPDPLGINAAIKPLLAVDDEIIVVCGDHGNSEHSPHACNLDEETIKTVLAIFNPADPTEKAETRLTSHLDLVLILQRLLEWPTWPFSTDAFEHGLEQREFAYSRTCFALQGQFGHPAGLDKPPRICIADGLLRVEIALPIIPADVQPRLWERPLEPTALYYSGTMRIEEPTERHQMMEQKLIGLEEKYRDAGLKYLTER